MNIIVPMKQVPDTEAIIQVDAGDKTKIVESGITFILNPYDEFALEEGLRIKERLGKGKVTAVTVGPARSDSALRDALSLGIDEAVHITDEGIEKADPFAVATILAKFLSSIPYDLILCGRQAIDDDSAQVPAFLAEMLNIPQAIYVVALEVDPANKKCKVKRDVDGSFETVEMPLPAILTCSKGLNEPRYPSIRGKMQAKKAQIPVKKLADLGLSNDVILNLKLKINSLELPPTRTAGKKLVGEVPEAVKKLVEELKSRKIL
jgi:electron transfer flavoprotein beta subunit